MKNKIRIFLILILTLNAVYATTQPTLYDRDSFVVTSVDYLARRSGIIGVYESFPATGTSVLYTFDKIDKSQLTDVEKTLYDQVDDELNKESNLVNTDDGFSVNVQLPVTIQSSVYGTSDGKLKYYELEEQYKDVDPWFDFRTQLYFGEHIYGYTQLAFQDSMDNALTDDASNFSTNLDSFSLIANDGSSFQIYQPFKIGLSVGDENANFQIGRNRQSVGSGLTGNFFIGDNFSKQDYLSFSLFSSVINYTCNVTEFDQQSGSLSFDDVSFNGEQQYRVMNRMRIEILDNLSLDLYQGAIFQIDSLNFRMLIPFMYIHNYYDFSDDTDLSKNDNDEANNILGIQAKWVMDKGNEFNLILTFDQIQLFESADTIPSAYGVLINYKNSQPYKTGMLNNSLEAVYTSPYLYLNEKTDGVDGKYDYNYDHILGNNYGDNDEVGYSGYYYGPDTLMFAYIVDYNDIDRWNLGADLTLRIQGENGIDYVDDNTDIIGNVVNSFLVGTCESTLTFKPRGYMDLTDYLNISGYVSFNTIFNHEHDTSADIFFDVQANLVATFNFI